MAANETSKPVQPWQAGPGGLTVARLYFAATSILSAVGISQLLKTGANSGQAIGSYSWQWAGLLSGAILLGVVLLAVTTSLFTPAADRMGQIFSALTGKIRLRPWLAVAGCSASWVLYVLVVLWRFDRHFNATYPRLWFFWLAAGVGALFLMSAWRRLPPLWALVSTGVLFGFGIKALSYLPEVSTYPFSLGWSEASRFYYASLPYAERLYGMTIPLSPWHPSRYLMLGLPFLIADAPLWLHRLWQVLLWLGFSWLTGFALLRRFRGQSWVTRLVGAVWAGLFLLQGPVYYHLLVCVILVLVGFDRERFWKTAVFVFLASLWAGISRVNWFPVPAILAATLYLLEKPVRGSRGWLAYLAQPAIWGGIGLGAALASQAIYVLFSGHEDTSGFASSFTSALLWYRLFPNVTYRLGVLPAILLITAPALALVAVTWARGWRHWHPLRVLGLGGMGLVLLAGGLVVSTKIGGGSNIHNLDAYLVLVLVISAYLWLEGYESESGGAPYAWRPWLLLVFLLLMPVTWNMDLKRPFVQRDMQQAQSDLDWLREFVTHHAQGGEALFITQRQLLVFDTIEGVDMVPEYELLTLSEMAISNNQAYLSRFHADLEKKRFRVIVANMQNEVTKDPEISPFAEENNAWVANVTTHIREYYKTAFTLPAAGVEIFLPK